jgi:hypothetical protein
MSSAPNLVRLASFGLGHAMRTVQIQGYEYLQQVGASIGGRATVDTPPDFAPLLQDLQRVTYQTSNGWVPLSAEYMLALSVSETAPSIGGGRQQRASASPLLRCRRSRQRRPLAV